ncbi:MAG: type 1 glutamine amidotransferase domain-containing protein [Collimonas pratensis]|uniref:type 1 glutamine amidotransferase domain-containing protein n=1 Tax=Collimonas pratensis TaxID=279113 RepID=UPI003C78D21E
MNAKNKRHTPAAPHGRSAGYDSPAELTLDHANEMSFPASDPVASTNITRIKKAPEMAPAAIDHQNINTTDPGAQGNAGSAVLSAVKIAILVTDGFEEVELLSPKKTLEAAGATVHVIADHAHTVQGFQHTEKTSSVDVDLVLADARPEEYDAVLLPGGVVNGDALRMSAAARGFVQYINKQNKPLASICHGGWLLISAGIAKGRTVTSWPSLQDDFINAGSKWLDRDVVSENNFVSSRKPEDIPAFMQAFIALLASQRATAPN